MSLNSLSFKLSPTLVREHNLELHGLQFECLSGPCPKRKLILV